MTSSQAPAQGTSSAGLARSARRNWALVLGAALLAGALALDGGFVHDDGRALLTNPVVRGELPASAAFTRDFWGGALDAPVRSYRPLLPFVWRGLWQLSPNDPLPFRALSCALHVAATASLHALLLSMMLGARAALLGALLFALHPVHSEALGAIVAQSDVASAALGMLALLLGTGSRPRMWSSAAVLVLACAAKETAIVFGPALIAHAVLTRPRTQSVLHTLARCLPCALVVLTVIAVQLSFERAPGGVLPESLARSLTGGLRALYGLHIIGHGTLLLLVPVGLAPHHGYAAVQPTLAMLGPYAVLGALVLMLSTTLGMYALRARSGALLGALGLWLGPLIIQSGFVVTPVTDIAERLLYTPSIVSCAVAGLVLARVITHEHLRRAVVIATLAVFGALSFEAQRAWVSDLSLWQRAVSVEPRSWQVQKNYAAQLSQAGRNAEAAWPFLVSFYLVRRYPAPVDFGVVDALQARPLEERLADGPFALEPEAGCAFAKVYLANMRRSAPELVATLTPIYAARGCGP